MLDPARRTLAIVVPSAVTVECFLDDYIRRLSKYLNILVICSELPSTGNCQAECTGILVKRVSIRRKPSPLFDLLALIQIILLLRRYDVTLLQSITSKGGFIGQLAGVIARVPYRVHIFTGQAWATRRGFARWILMCFDKAIARFSTHTIVDSPSQREYLRENNILGANEGVVIGYGSVAGVDLARFYPDESKRHRDRSRYNCSDEDFIVGYLGRINRDKGVLDLIEVFDRFYSSENGVKLLICGTDEMKLIERLKIDYPGIGSRLILLSHTDSIEDVIRMLDLLVLPSYREGFGNILIEASACGIPVLGSDIYGIRDAILDGHNGLLFTPRDIAGIAHAIQKLRVDPNLRRSLGVSGVKYVKERFNKQDVILRNIEYILRVMQE